MKNRTVIITGGNDGIGYQTALELARMGAAIVMVCRNEQKAQAAVESIRTATGNNSVQYALADLSSQKAIRRVGEEIHGRVAKIDVLINNAGGAFSGFELSEDGLEMTIATNHFAYFLLTGLLLDLLKKSGEGRIINVSSDSHYRGKMNFDSFRSGKNYFLGRAYAQSKLANVLFTFELAERLKKDSIDVNCLNPGFVKTRIGNKAGKWASYGWSLITLFAISREAGAQTSVYLASSPQVKGVTGKYFNKGKPQMANPLAYDAALRKKLWDVSEKYSGGVYPD